MTEPSVLSHARRPLGKSERTVSPLAWGMWRLRGSDVAAARTLVEAALETGIDLFDTADVYGLDNGETFGAAEALLGRVFASAPGVRDKIMLATKGGIEIGSPYNSSADYLIRACEASLSRLATARIDLYQIHRPDTLCHPAEIAGALDRLRRDGKILEAGVSNYSAAQTAALEAHMPFPLASIQPEFSPLAIEPLSDGVLDQALARDLTVLAWSPLAGGRVAAPTNDRARNVRAALSAVADRAAVSIAAAAYAWIIAHPARPIPIVGSQRVERIRESGDALKISFTRSEWYAVLTAARGKALP